MTRIASLPITVHTRRRALRALSWPAVLPLRLPLATLTLAGCAAAPPAPRLLRWPTEVPEPFTATPARPASGGAWRLMPWGALPEWMDSLELLVADGPAGLRALPGVRWAEPLRDALPRLLVLDLGRLRSPQPLWTDAVPTGAAVDQLLRVQVLAMENLPTPSASGVGQVRLLARWSLADPAGQRQPLLVDERIVQPWDGSADGLAVAQRATLWTLATHIAAGVPPASRTL